MNDDAKTPDKNRAEGALRKGDHRCYGLDCEGQMNLRTISFWALYDPKRKAIIATAPTKKALTVAQGKRKGHCIAERWVVVKMKGHYVLPCRSDRGTKK